MADKEAGLFLRDDEVGRAAGDALWFVGRRDTRVERFQQILQGGTMRVLGVIAFPVIGFKAAQIGQDGRRLGGTAITGRFFAQKVIF